MNVQEKIECTLRECTSDIQTTQERCNETMETLYHFREKLESLPSYISVQIWRHTIEFNHISGEELDREQTLEVIRHFGGDWEKEKDTDFRGSEEMVYQQTIDNKFYLKFRGSPPPSCKIVEVEEEEPARPARVVKKRKIICEGAVAEPSSQESEQSSPVA